MEKILLVEDNKDLADVLLLHLHAEGFETDHAADGEEGLRLAITGNYALILLDISLPKLDGLHVLTELRKQHPAVPVIMLTSRAQEIDKVVGLNLGADDYVTKPFGVAELMARIRARLRRGSTGKTSENIHSSTDLVFGPLAIDIHSRRAYLRNAEIELTTKEFDLLAFLASHAGQAFSMEDILNELWADTRADYSSSLHNLIMRIRKKIEDDPANPALLKTVRGYGYRFTTKQELECP